MKAGDKYATAATPRNTANGILPGKEAYLSHIGPDLISVTIVQNAGHLKIAVPRVYFGSAFIADRSYLPPSTFFISAKPFTKLYR